MPENDDAPGFEIVNKINPSRLIQQNLEQIAVAQSPDRAALGVAKLYHTLQGIRRIDTEFDAEWNQVLNGRFVGLVSRDDTRFNLSWATVWRAQEILLGLMERHGMSFQAQLEDPLLVRRSQARAHLIGHLGGQP